jgi:PadR family transcriptional regulator, regulatory protein PadR
MSRPSDLIQGTLDLLILKTVALEPRHGWAIAKRIQQVSRDVLLITQGSLYPALHRLEKRGWLSSKWGISEANHKAKYYELTATGKEQLLRERDRWSQLVSVIGRIMNPAANEE